MKNKKDIGIKGSLIFLTVIPLLLVIPMWKINRILFFVALTAILIADIIIFVKFNTIYQKIYKLMAGVVKKIDTNQRGNLHAFPIPVIVVTENREIVWYSPSFSERIFTSGELYGVEIDVITSAELSAFCSKEGKIICYNDLFYKVIGDEKEENGVKLYTLYFLDVTDIQKDSISYHKTRPSVMLIMLDNYGEIMQQAKESEKSRILGEIDTSLEEFIGKETSSFIKRYDGDKFLVVIEEQHLENAIKTRFEILDKVRKIQTAGNLPVTLSIGIGRGEKTLAQSEVSARQALDMALGRGGDQAVIKNKTLYEFYGGVSKGVEKRTKVKTRMVANALSELIANSDRVLVMGHKFGDLDCVGAAVGMAYAIRSIGKNADVVIDRNKNLANILIDMVAQQGNEDLFIDPQEALFRITPNTLLIICDTHTENLLESEEIYRKCKTVAVIDHHRKMVNHIENAVIFYHEPYASSASEMVAELVQYMGDDCRINSVVAQALLSGIMLDTRNFVLKTGVRTFEAAAYLKRIGADTVIVRKLFASTMDSYQRKSRIVAAAQIYKGCAVAESEYSSEDMRIVAPQAADELLGIDNVDASFVLYETDGVVNISARSMGAINVQIIMENLGGGGHHTMAGAQIKGVESEKVRQMLLESIDRYFEEK